MPGWLRDAVFYEIYPQSFQDSNADGIGDFQGIIRRLDYIKELGCNAIWMNPCYESPFADAGYDVADYYRAAKRYGTNEDLKELFSEVHKRGMHLILDLVPGHTSLDCKWFQESMKIEKNEYSDRYIWTDSVWTDLTGISNISGCIRGISQRNGSCATNFFSTQPALNYGFANPDKDWQFSPDSPEALATRQAMKDIMAFWMNMGCDGFRVDMAASLVKGDGEDRAENIRLWQDVRKFLDENFPEAAIVSEWGQPDQAVKGGFHMDFLLHVGPTRYLDLFRTEHPYFSREGKGNIRGFVDKYQEYYDASNNEGFICIPSSNHDMPRLGGKLDEEEIKLVFAFLMSMPGVPFVYYGDEIGMKYLEDTVPIEGGFERCGSRTPMQWDQSTNAGFSSAPAEDLYLPLDSDPKRPTVAAQMADETSLWREVQKLIALRKAHPALLSDGKLEFLYAEEGAYPFVYKRSSEEEEILVILNPSGSDAEFPAELCPQDQDLAQKVIYQYGTACSMESKSWKVPAASACFVKLK